MAYTRTTLISTPVESAYGISEALGGVLDTLSSGVSSVIDAYGAGVRAQGAAQALTQIEIERARAQRPLAPAPAAPAAKPAISTTALVVGGLAVAGLLVFAMRGPKKNPALKKRKVKMTPELRAKIERLDRRDRAKLRAELREEQREAHRMVGTSRPGWGFID